MQQCMPLSSNREAKTRPYLIRRRPPSMAGHGTRRAGLQFRGISNTLIKADIPRRTPRPKPVRRTRTTNPPSHTPAQPGRRTLGGGQGRGTSGALIEPTRFSPPSPPPAGPRTLACHARPKARPRQKRISVGPRFRARAGTGAGALIERTGSPPPPRPRTSGIDPPFGAAILNQGGRNVVPGLGQGLGGAWAAATVLAIHSHLAGEDRHGVVGDRGILTDETGAEDVPPRRQLGKSY